MRRRIQWGDMPPPILLRFDPKQWPADTPDASFKLWRAARAEFYKVHGWPGGDFIDMLRQGIEERSRVLHGNELGEASQ